MKTAITGLTLFIATGIAMVTAAYLSVCGMPWAANSFC